MQYKLSFGTYNSHFINIEIIFKAWNKDSLELNLPIWRPGRYEAANYSKNLTCFSATSEDGLLEWARKGHSTWKVNTRRKSTFSINYKYYAHTMDAGSSWYDDTLIYINFINCLLSCKELIHEPATLDIALPEDYNVGCALEKTGNRFIAKDYYELVDSPLVASASLKQLKYQVKNIDFYIWYYGRPAVSDETLVKDFKKFSAAQLATFGSFPTPHYHFLIIFLPYKSYHGVEHGASTVICLGPQGHVTESKLYTELLGVSSHELFHAWNIIKIRPEEMLPYDFNNPIQFKTGFVAEGFTTYYGDLMLCRSQVFDRVQYFKELNAIIDRHNFNFGKSNESVVSSSLGLWVDGYHTGAPNKKSSIYVEGAMIALALDLRIRQKSENTKSLDNVMLELWHSYGKADKGYSLKDIQATCEKVHGESLSLFFNKYVKGIDPIMGLIKGLLDHVGCTLIEQPNENFIARRLGLRGSYSANKFTVMQIHPDSVANKFISLQDEIMTINNTSSLKWKSETDDQVTIKLNRNNQEVEVDYSIGTYNYFNQSKLSLSPGITDKQISALNGWLQL